MTIVNVSFLSIVISLSIKYYKLIGTLIFYFIILNNSTLTAQQNPQFSQYLQNPFVINPAMTGVENYVDINIAYRNQWTGFNGAPKTATLSINGALYPSKIGYLPEEGTHQGVGAFIYNDGAGPISQSGFYGSYAYHIQLSENWFLSLGTFIGVKQFKFDTSEVIIFDSPIDPLIQNISDFNFDLSLGLYTYSRNMFFGLAANQILNKQISFSDSYDGNSIVSNYNFLAGGRINIREEIQLVSFTLLKFSENTPVSWDAGAKLIYNNKFWGGAAYRDQEAIVGFFGLRITDNLLFSYSYDWVTTQFNNQQSGSHEIIIGYRFSLDKLNCACPQYSL
ncbi:PorP/SprF family type IX secretion system membrane protein [Seonamhaeicola aphaedonensis]|nr:type IX secretion system membrane protein PorP/SprF [Seonamhaeicola aphaedonensis]